jgi:hypothetical protein
MAQPDFLDRHMRVIERIRRIETGVHKLPPGVGTFGRRRGWMVLTPAPPCEYDDPDQPARRIVYADVVRVVCPGLVVPDGDHRIFTLGPSARPSYAQRAVCTNAAYVSVAINGDITVRDATGTITFDMTYTLG